MRRFLAALALAALLLARPGGNARAQGSWTTDPDNPQIPGEVGGGYALAPSVIYDATTGVYRMWFTMHSPGGPWGIGLALSIDGSHWFAYAKNPVLSTGALAFESDGAVYAGVVFDGVEYRMYYTGISGCCTTAIGLATSSDGITWTRYAANPILTPSPSGWDVGGIGASTGIAFDGSTFSLFYQGLGAAASKVMARIESSGGTIEAGVSQQIGLATSTDGVHFTKSAANPVLSPGGPGSWNEAGVFPGGAFWHDGVLYAFYAGAPADLSTETLGLATSSNGIAWAQDPHNPVFSGVSGWDAFIGGGAAVLRNATLELWYSGNAAGAVHWSIGHATSPFDQPTATLASLVSVAADAGGVHLVWDTGVSLVTVMRRRDGAGLAAVGTRVPVAGRVSFDDANVEPAHRYAYTLARGASGETLLGETSIDVPARPSLELRGAQPNPSAGAITASFSIPAPGRVSLELFDLAGRRVRSREFELAAGVHLLPLDPDVASPGVYLLRLTFGDRRLETRVVVAK